MSGYLHAIVLCRGGDVRACRLGGSVRDVSSPGGAGVASVHGGAAAPALFSPPVTGDSLGESVGPLNKDPSRAALAGAAPPPEARRRHHRRGDSERPPPPLVWRHRDLRASSSLSGPRDFASPTFRVLAVSGSVEVVLSTVLQPRI